MSSQFNIKSIEELIPLFYNSAKPVLLLGAGTTVKSGIPLADEMVEKVALWTYCKNNGISVDDITISNEIVRSDWDQWLKKQLWFNPTISRFENYPDAIESLKPPQKRKDFFRWILSQKTKPSSGFEFLAHFVKEKAIRTILTTNFDDTIETALKQSRIDPEKVDNTDAQNFIDPNPEHAQVIYLHGSVDLYSDKNIKTEIEVLNKKLVTNINPIINHNPLVVIGYRGAENSIMKSLLKCDKAKRNDFRKGIFWCVREPFDETNLTDQVRQLATKIGDSFIFITINDFDSCLELLWNKYAKTPNYNIPDISISSNKIPKNDYNTISTATLSDLNQPLLEQKLIAYAKKMRMTVPDSTSQEWVISQSIKANLVRRVEEVDKPTFAGYILFANSVRKFLKNSRVNFNIHKDENWLKKVFPGVAFSEIQEERVIEGNLWYLLDELLDLLKNFNREYFLKGDIISQTVTPYDPIVIRELVVNSIVHRDYKSDNPIVINITKEYIEIINPGGLVEEVQKEIKNESLEAWIKSGNRGAKGYRNPVIADLFYGSDRMEKEGSGLSDAWKKTIQNNAEISFGQDSDNKNFFAKIFTRNDFVDDQTSTALKTKQVTTNYISNILKFIKLPDKVHVAISPVRKYSEVFKKIGDSWCPPFVMHSGLLVSFFEFSDQNPLSKIVEAGSRESFNFNDYDFTEDTHRVIVWLLNESLQRHFFNKGLYLDKKNKRAFFAKNPDNTDVSVKYFSMHKQATRLVTRKRTSPVTGDIKYWEHKSFKFQVEKIKDDWLLFLNPGYVFTRDGKNEFLAQEKHGRLATRKASRDYNLIYLRNLFFWKWILSGGANELINLKTINQLSPDEESEFDVNAKIVIDSAFEKIEYTEVSFLQNEVTIADILEIEDDYDDNEEIKLID